MKISSREYALGPIKLVLGAMVLALVWPTCQTRSRPLDKNDGHHQYHNVEGPTRRSPKIDHTNMTCKTRVSHPTDGQRIDPSDIHVGARMSKFHEIYHSYDEIRAHLVKISRSNDRMQLVTVGTSFEGRDLFLVKLSGDFSAQKPVIFIDAGQHAREWISISTALYALESLANSDEGLKRFDFWLMPIVNTDGYEFSRNAYRNWRKTRSKTRKVPRGCEGVDTNRNFPVDWNKVGSSRDPCSEIYAGQTALSEPETIALANVLMENRNRIRMYISLHSYGQMILYPYGHKESPPSNLDEHQEVAQAFIRAVYKVRGIVFKSGSAGQIMGFSSGGSDDFALMNANIRLSFTIELPPRLDDNWIGFEMSPSEIIPIGRETTIGLLAMTDGLARLEIKEPGTG